MFEDDTWLRELRLSRSDPPGHAGESEERRAVYNSALEQFEELLVAASRIGVAAKPLPMFYALSQAGRSIAAARVSGNAYEIRGHGLREVRSDPPTSDVMHSRVARQAHKDGADAFGLVSRAIGSPDFEGEVEFGAIWAGTPDLHRLPDDSWKADWRLALDVLDKGHSRPTTGVVAEVVSWSGNPLVDFETTIQSYPALTADSVKFVSQLQSAPGVVDLAPGMWSVLTEWSGEGVLIDRILPKVGLRDGRRLIPPLPGHTQPLDTLMLVWLLAYSMSIFARYNPGPWGRALSVNSSTRAVPLEAMMDQILAAVPLLVYDAIFRPAQIVITEPADDDPASVGSPT